MSPETRSSLRASERRRQRVVVAGVAGVAVLTAGAIAYWPGEGPRGSATAAESTLVLPGRDATGTTTDQGWDPTAATTTPKATDPSGTDAARSSRGETRPSLTSTGPATDSTQAPAGTTSGAPGSAATSVPVLPSTSAQQPGSASNGARSKPTPTDTDATTTGTPTPSSTSTSSSTPTPTATPSPTKTKNRCVLFLLC